MGTGVNFTYPSSSLFDITSSMKEEKGEKKMGFPIGREEESRLKSHISEDASKKGKTGMRRKVVKMSVGTTI